MRYHKVEYTVEAKLGHAKTGCTKAEEQAIVNGYQVQYDLCEDSKAIEQIKRKKGRLILSTNKLEQSKMPDSEILSEYKAQSGTERSFKFLKEDSIENRCADDGDDFVFDGVVYHNTTYANP